MAMELFEHASKARLRFATPVGVLAVDDLWDLPLTTKRGGFSLDDLARQLNRELKDAGEESFVDERKAAPADALQQMRFDVVKRIIAIRVAERDLKAAEAARKAERQKLMGLLADKRDERLKAMSVEEIEAMLAAATDPVEEAAPQEA